MSLTPYFFNRPFGSSYLDPLSSFDDFFDPFALSAPSAFGGLTSGGGGVGGGGGLGTALQHPIHDLENMAVAPVMDVRDQGDKYQVLCKPPPNFNQNDLHVRVDRDILSVSGQHSESEERGTSKRQSRRSFTRLIRLPDTVDQQQIAAKWTNDGLSIQLPKKAGALESGRRIQIEGVESSSQQPPSSAGLSYSTTPAGSGSGSAHQTSSGDFRSAGGIGGGSASSMQKGSATESAAMEAEPSK